MSDDGDMLGLRIGFEFDNELVAQAAAEQLRHRKGAIVTEIQERRTGWQVWARCELPEWALEHLAGGCHSFASAHRGIYLGWSRRNLETSLA